MKIVLTVVLAAIFLAAVWSGYRRGLILSAAQLAAIVVAFYGAALLAGQFSDRLLPVAEPFAGGYFEGQLDVVAAGLPDNDAGLSGEDWVAAHPDTAQEYAEQCFAAAGVSGRAGQRMARSTLSCSIFWPHRPQKRWFPYHWCSWLAVMPAKASHPGCIERKWESFTGRAASSTLWGTSRLQ